MLAKNGEVFKFDYPTNVILILLFDAHQYRNLHKSLFEKMRHFLDNLEGLKLSVFMVKYFINFSKRPMIYFLYNFISVSNMITNFAVVKPSTLDYNLLFVIFIFVLFWNLHFIISSNEVYMFILSNLCFFTQRK